MNVYVPTMTQEIPPGLEIQEVTEIEHYTDTLFRFCTTRPRSLRFRSGEFVMIGLMQETGKPLLRAYSIASAAWDDKLEFYSIKVPDGPLTSVLQHIKPGDQILINPKPVGTLVHDALLPGKRLWFFATGTGIAPFASLLRDPQTYEDYGQVILTHTCRHSGELTYGQNLARSLKEDPLIGELVAPKLTYFPTTTRENSPKMGRITSLLQSGKLFAELGIPAMNPATDRVMVCGSLEFNRDMQSILDSCGLTEGANSKPAEYVVEKSFVEK